MVFGLTQISLFVVFGLTQIPLFVVLAHTDPTDLTEFFVGGFWLTQIPRISLNCIDDGKSHRIVWLESGGGFLILIFYD